MPGSLLAFEAVTRTASWCVQLADGQCIHGDLDGGPAAAGLVPALHAAMDAHGRPDALAVATGPGSFTGLRIGVVAARTLAWVEQLPVYPVDTMAAIAAAAGPGLWWVLLSLKRDTTFHALYEVQESGLITTVQSPQWCLDAEQPQLHERTRHATAIGPVLNDKAGLAEQWCPGIALGSAAGCQAIGVAAAAASCQAVAWSELDAHYGIASAPELQRQQRQAGGNG